MKKAKQYANEIIEKIGENIMEPCFVVKLKDAVMVMSKELKDEIVLLKRKRNAIRDGAILSIFKEINLKYKSICRKVNAVYPITILKEDGWESHLANDFGISLEYL